MPGRRARVGGMRKKTRGSLMKREYFSVGAVSGHAMPSPLQAATKTGQGHIHELTSTIRATYFRFFQGPEGGRAWVLRKMDPHRSADL